MARMSVVLCLKDLKDFIEQSVAKNVKLLKENSNPEEYVNPYVALATMPHKNFMPVNFQVPHILIGIADGHDNVSVENKINIRIQCAVYGGDIQFQYDANLPDEKGYIALLSLEEKIIHELTQKAVIGNCVIDTEFDYGIYNEEITYPYWYGYVQFAIQIPTVNRQMIEFI